MNIISKRFKLVFTTLLIVVSLGLANIGIIGLEASESTPITVTAAYSGSTGNMTVGNNASTVGLSSEDFSVISTERNGSPLHVGLNKDGQIRLYGNTDGNGNILSISIAEGKTITGVEFRFGSTVGKAQVMTGETEQFSGSLTPNSTLNFSDLNVSSFSIKNTSTSQIYILSIDITYIVNPIEPEPEPEPFVPDGELSNLEGSFLLVGDYLFDLTKGTLNLQTFLKATQTAYFNSETEEYEIYFKIGANWFNLASENPYSESFSAEEINGGEGYKYFDSVHISDFQLITNKTQKLGYQDLQTAINEANASDVIVLNNDVEISSTLQINNTITLDGMGYSLIATEDFGTNNSAKHSINVFADNVTIKNLVVEAESFTYGIQAYGSMQTTLTDVTINKSKGAALTVNGASVVANNLVTSLSAWGSVNIDSKIGTQSSFTLNSGALSEDLQIWSEEANANIVAPGYSEYVYENGIREFSANPVSSKVYFVENNITYIFDTIQAAIDAATAGETINVNAGTYIVPTGIQINKPNLTLKANGLVEIKYSEDPTAYSASGTMGISVLKNLGTVTVEGFNVYGYESGIVQGMAQSVGTTFIVKDNTVYPGYRNGSAYMRNGIQVTGVGSRVIGNTVIGAPMNESWSNTAINIVNTNDVIVENNTITDTYYDIGISVMNWNSPVPVNNIIIRNNTITNAVNAFRISGNVSTGMVSNVLIENNSVFGPTTTPEVLVSALNVQTVTLDDVLFKDNLVTFNNERNLVVRLSSLSISTNVVLEQAGVQTAVINTEAELKALVSATYAGTIDQIRFGSDINITSQVSVARTVTIDGHGFALVATQNFGEVNGYKHSMNIYADDVVINNLVIEAAYNTYGLQAYETSNLTLNDVTVTNSKGAGLTVNGSSVTADGFTSSGNAWGGINVDSPSVELPSSLTLSNASILDSLQLWSEDHEATILADGFEEFVYENGFRVFTNLTYQPEIFIIRGEVTYVFETLQGAINGAVADEVILVQEGLYEQNNNLVINKPVTIKGIGNVTIQPASSFTFTSNANKNLVLVDTVTGLVKLENLTIQNSLRTGLNVYLSSQVELQDVKIINSAAAGMIVNGSEVQATNLETFGNAWGSVNVDQGGGVTAIPVFTLLGTSLLMDAKQIWAEKSVAVINAQGYQEYILETGERQFSNTVFSYNLSIIRGNVVYVFETLQGAIDGANDFDLILVFADLSQTETIQVNKSVIIEGQNHKLEATSAFSTVNGYKQSLNIYADNVVVRNLIINANDFTFGVQAYKAANVELFDVTINHSLGAALTVNGSNVRATNLTTSGNTWGSVNVDSGSGVTEVSSFELISGTLSDDTQIWAEKESAVINATDYAEFVYENGFRVFTNRPFEPNVSIIRGHRTFVFSSVQKAITAATQNETIHVLEGEYLFPTKVWITKDVTIDGESGVIFKSEGNDILGIQPNVTLSINDVVFMGTSHVGIDMAASATLNGTNLSFEGLTTGIYVNPNGIVNVSNSAFKDVLASIGTDTKARYFTLSNNTFENVGEVLGFTASNDTERNFNMLRTSIVANNPGVTSEQIIAYGSFIIAINETTGVGYTSIQSAINASQNGDVIAIEPGTYALTEQLKVTKAVTLEGIEEVIIKAAENFNLGTYNADKHLVSVIGVEGLVTLENLTVQGSKRSGINIFESTDVQLLDITLKDNYGAGLGVTNSKVTATNLVTSGNGWSSINVDNGSNPGVNAPATEFILVSGTIQSAYSNAGNVSVTMPNGYYTYNYFGYPTLKHVWSPVELELTTDAIIRVNEFETNVYTTIQLAYQAVQDFGTIEVLPGTYTFASRIDVTKNITILGQEGVVFNSTNPTMFVVQSGKVMNISEVEFTGGNSYGIELAANSTTVITHSTFRTKYGIYVNTNANLSVTDTLFEVTGGVAIGTDTKAASLLISNNTFADGLGEALGFTAPRDIETNFIALEAEIVSNNTGATVENINAYGTFSKDYAMVVALMASVTEIDYTNASWATYEDVLASITVSESSTLAQTSQAYDTIKAAQAELVVATVFNTSSNVRYASIQVAINEALENEVILVTEGTYDGFEVKTNGLTIETEGDVFVRPNYFAAGSLGQTLAILVSGAQNVVLDGMQIVGNNEYAGIAGFNGATFTVTNMHFENLVRGIYANANNLGTGFVTTLTITNSSFENLLVGVGGTENSILSANNNVFELGRTGSEGFGIGSGVTFPQTLPGLLKANTYTLTNDNFAAIDYRTSPVTYYGKTLYLSSARAFNDLIDATFFDTVHFTSTVSNITVTRAVDIDFGNYAVNNITITTNDSGVMNIEGDQFVNTMLKITAPNLVVNNYVAVFGTLDIISALEYNDFS